LSGFTERKCPLCGTAPPSTVEISSERPAESLSFEELAPHWNGFHTERIFFSYARCPVCSLLYAPKFFSDEQLTKLYDQMPPNMQEVPDDAKRRTQRGYFEALKTRPRVAGGYLEVGPDIGLFTENCVREGRFDRYWLFEPNRDVLPTLTATMRGSDFQIVPDMFGFDCVPDRSAGAAVMIQVLDHLLDPVATLRELKTKLADEASLIIVTHNEGSILRRLFQRNWVPFCMQHPQVYSRRSMRSLVEAAGYKLESIERTKNYFPVQFLVHQLSWACGLKIAKAPSFGDISLGLKLGNILTVAAPA
jgi:hypothetical protein